MATPLTINGTTYQFPQQFDRNWGPTVTNWATAVTTGMLQKAGGSFHLTAETDFGSSFGIKLAVLKSQEANAAATGFLRLGNASPGIVWRNAGNSADLALTVSASNQLTFNGVSIGATTALTNGHILVGNVSNQPADVAMSGDTTITNAGVVTLANSAVTDAKVSSSAAITLSKLAATTAYYWYAANVSGVLTPLAVTASKAVATDANGLPTASATTATELGYLSGATSAVQTQLNARLQLSGGTMSGNINMGSNGITALAAGTASGQAIAYRQGSQAVDGSTANSGGSAGTVQQGTISTPDFRANAVTNAGNATDSTPSASTSGTGASTTITTLGKPVIILASVTLSCTSQGSPNHFQTLTAQIQEDGVNIGFPGRIQLDWGSTTVTFSFDATQLNCFAYSTPSAGSHTYRINWTSSNALAGVTYSNSQITAVELRA